MRIKYTITDGQLKTLMDACRPVAYICIGGREPASPQENANNAWKRLGEEVGFKWDTVEPSGSDPKMFTAEMLVTAKRP